MPCVLYMIQEWSPYSVNFGDGHQNKLFFVIPTQAPTLIPVLTIIRLHARIMIHKLTTEVLYVVDLTRRIKLILICTPVHDLNRHNLHREGGSGQSPSDV